MGARIPPGALVDRSTLGGVQWLHGRLARTSPEGKDRNAFTDVNECESFVQVRMMTSRMMINNAPSPMYMTLLSTGWEKIPTVERS